MRKQVELRGTRPFTDTTRDIARAVIVAGEPSIEVQARFGVTKQRVSAIVARYYQAYLSMDSTEGDLPVLWLKHGFEMPNNLVKPLEIFLTKAKRNKDVKRIQSAVAAVIKALDAQASRLK